MSYVFDSIEEAHLLTIHARNMIKSAFIRSQLEASKIGQKDILNKSSSRISGKTLVM